MKPKYALAIAIAIVAVAGCGGVPATSSAPGGSTGPAGSASTQTSERSGVTVAVTWDGPSAGGAFEVKLDNHMVDLASIDLSAAVLSNDRGETANKPVWDGGESGHHRDGKLTFSSSSPSFFSGAKWIRLELPAVGDARPRDFTWTL